MRLLLDTHALIWAMAQSRSLSSRVAALLADRTNTILVSVASAYEIEFKRPRSPELGGLPADLDGAVEAMEFDWLHVTPTHATTAGRLPRLHGDPFDRLIVAQALTEQATVLTRDPLIARYGAPVIW